jgi:pimeloyl-ACP methyl ester carboxylesterase
MVDTIIQAGPANSHFLRDRRWECFAMRHHLHHGVFLREFGAEAGTRTVLWIHGLGESGLCFERIPARPGLTHWRHLVPDLPGYGRTAWPSTPLSLGDLAALLADLVSDLVGGPVVVAGHSMGGVVALLLAERFGSLVRGVVDIDGNKSPDDCAFSSRAAALAPDDFAAGGFDELRDRVYTAGLDDPAQRGYYASLRLANPASYHRNSFELVELSAREDLALRLAALSCPRCYIAGAPGGVCVESRRLLSDARVPVIEISPSGHWPFVDQPDAFAAAVLEFLAEVG